MIWDLSPEFCRAHEGAESSGQEQWSQTHVFLHLKRMILLYANHMSINLTLKKEGHHS